LVIAKNRKIFFAIDSLLTVVRMQDIAAFWIAKE